MTDPRPLSMPARVLTLDQAYAFAYADLRRRCIAFCDEEPDMLRRGKLLDDVEEAAHRLALDLQSVLLTRTLASELARPE